MRAHQVHRALGLAMPSRVKGDRLQSRSIENGKHGPTELDQEVRVHGSGDLGQDTAERREELIFFFFFFSIAFWG